MKLDPTSHPTQKSTPNEPRPETLENFGGEKKIGKNTVRYGHRQEFSK